MTPSWYDLLDVEADASTEEIRTAWKARIADLDPTDRRFAVLNRAATVLLDPASRAAYDAELAEAAAAEADEDGTDESGTAVAAEPPAGEKPAAKKRVGSTTTGGSAAAEPARRPLSVAVLAAVAGLAFLTIAVIAWTGSEDESDVEDGIADARTAAEQAIVPILSYDATDLEAGRSSATSFMTDDFREDYEALFDGLVEDNAANLGISVTGERLASAIVRVDGGRVQVLVFADQTRTTAASAQPQVFSNQVTVTMEQVEDRWLVDDLETGTAG